MQTQTANAPATLDSAPSVGFSRFNPSHWFKVKAERVRLGINKDNQAVLPIEHPLVGTILVDQRTNTPYLVESVSKDWLNGWFYRAMLKTGDSHAVRVIENISSTNEGVLQGVLTFNRVFVPLK